MVDIREGDVLVVGSEEYPVKAVEIWTKASWNTAAFKKMANVSASTKRNPAVNATTGKRGSPVAKLSGLSITPLDPVTQDVIERLALESPVRLLETFIADSTGFVHVIVEDLQYT
jgi:hypothetical protein